MVWGFPDNSAARQRVWDRLAAEGVARFPFPPHSRIPNFSGAELAAARLLEIGPWKSARGHCQLKQRWYAPAVGARWFGAGKSLARL